MHWTVWGKAYLRYLTSLLITSTIFINFHYLKNKDKGCFQLILFFYESQFACL